MGKSSEDAPLKVFSGPALYLPLFVLYLASTVPDGLMLYGLKSKVGWDMFAVTPTCSACKRHFPFPKGAPLKTMSAESVCTATPIEASRRSGGKHLRCQPLCA